jgi:hypothetical protein
VLRGRAELRKHRGWTHCHLPLNNDRGLSNLVATAHDGLYFPGIDALTSDLDQAARAANELGQTVVAQLQKIARSQERQRRVALENVGLQASVLPVPEMSAADDKFANFPGTRSPSSLVDQSDRYVGQETAAWHP